MPSSGIGVSVIAMVLTAALIAYQRHVVARTGSLAIGTDRLHYSSDLLLNGSVIVALGLDQYAAPHRSRRGLRPAHRRCGCCGARGARRATRSTS